MSCLERCPYFRGVLIEGFQCILFVMCCALVIESGTSQVRAAPAQQHTQQLSHNLCGFRRGRYMYALWLRVIVFHTLLVASFDPAKHFDTNPAMMSRSYNRPTSQQLTSVPLNHTPEAVQVKMKSDFMLTLVNFTGCFEEI